MITFLILSVIIQEQLIIGRSVKLLMLTLKNNNYYLILLDFFYRTCYVQDDLNNLHDLLKHCIQFCNFLKNYYLYKKSPDFALHKYFIGIRKASIYTCFSI